MQHATRNTQLRTQNSELRITPYGLPATGDLAEQALPRDPEERLALARRLVCDRCLYGVDKNPLAVEMAKLFTLAVTLQKGSPVHLPRPRAARRRQPAGGGQPRPVAPLVVHAGRGGSGVLAGTAYQ